MFGKITPVLVDGKKIAARVESRVAKEIRALGVQPYLAVGLVGNDPASRIYVRRKGEAAERLGIGFSLCELPASASQAEVSELIGKLNADPRVNGIIVQLPLPSELDELAIINRISPEKDVDGITDSNLSRLPFGKSLFMPATAGAVLEVLRRQKVRITGSRAVVVGRGRVAGLPTALALIAQDATVSVAHSKTKDLAALTKQADILVSAVGKPRMIKPAMVKRGAAVIDVGISRVRGKLCGDVGPAVERVAAFVTPVPGGIGPITVAKLLENTLQAWHSQNIR